MSIKDRSVKCVLAGIVGAAILGANVRATPIHTVNPPRPVPAPTFPIVFHTKDSRTGLDIRTATASYGVHLFQAFSSSAGVLPAHKVGTDPGTGADRFVLSVRRRLAGALATASVANRRGLSWKNHTKRSSSLCADAGREENLVFRVGSSRGLD